MAKLKKLLEDVFQDKPQINRHQVIEGVKSFGVVGKALYGGNILEVAKKISDIAESAHGHVLSETDDWFDQVSVNKNMQSLKKRVAEFQKTAQESHQLNQRLTGLYEDMGHILNRYYDIHEDNLVGETVNDPDGLAPNSPDKTGEEMKEAVDGDKAPDGGGDEGAYAAKDGEDMKESSNSNPHNVDGNNQNANWPSKDGEEMQEIKRSLKDIGGVVGIPALGDMLKRK
tara:strand:+ start:658 stop:1341 length:684 start_codon:yes stop_codon:yes gene_type:complete